MLKSWQITLEDAFKIFNEELFDGELPPVVITLQSSPRSNGHITTSKVWRAESERLYEINISAEHLDREMDRVCGTLVHEMCHLYAMVNNLADSSQAGRYHNKVFRRIGEEHGLILEYAKYIGWSVTTPGPRLIEVIRSHGIEKPMDINRDGIQIDLAGLLGLLGGGTGAGGDNGLMVPTKTKSSTRKYQCPCCLNSFRATKDINVMCMDCNEQFLKVEK